MNTPPRADEIDILADIMNHELAFYRMVPADGLLSDHDARGVWCLAEPGAQYLVFSIEGNPFTLELQSGDYHNNRWIDTRTGEHHEGPPIATDGSALEFTPPSTATDWVLLIRSQPRATASSDWLSIH